MLNTEDAIKELEKLKKSGANLLIPDIVLEGLSDWHKVVIEKIQLNPEPQPKGLDCYKDNQSSLLRLTGYALEKLAVSANVQWNLQFCGRTDDRSVRSYVAYRSVGGIRKPDGSIVWMSNTYDVDLDAEREEMIESYTEKARKANKNAAELKHYVHYCVNRDYNFRNKHKLKLCESGSRNRVIRKILNIKTGYSAEEMAHPFCTVRVIFQPDMKDPEVKRQLLAAAIQATTGIYGNIAQSAPPMLPAPFGDVIDIPANGGSYKVIEPEDNREPEEPMPPPEENDAPPRFEDLDATAQAESLSNLARQKDFPTELITKEEFKEGKRGITRPFDKMGDKARLQWWEYLNALEEAVEDDIPL